jgi:hypothetical protein
MTTISSEQEQAEVRIPGAYLADVRTALAGEVKSYAEWIVEQHAEMLRGPSGDVEGPIRYARNGMQLVEQVFAADEGVTVRSDRGVILAFLERFVDVLVERLGDEASYSPKHMGTVTDLADRLRWAAAETIRIEPALDRREEA